MRPIDCLEIPVGNYQSTLLKIPEKCESNLHPPKPEILHVFFVWDRRWIGYYPAGRFLANEIFCLNN